MKNNSTLALLLGITLLTASCKKNNDPSNATPAPGSNFSNDILRQVPKETIDKVRALGISVYDGQTPPNVEGVYMISRNYMTKSSVPNESIAADGFTDLKIKIYNQNLKALTASIDTKSIDYTTGNVIATSTGQGTYLAGNGNFFSLFVIEETTKKSNNSRSRTLQVYSGEITTQGIRNLESTLFMLDDYGDPNNDLIPVDTGRAFKDNDGFSERSNNFRQAAEELVAKPKTLFAMGEN